MRSIRWPWAGFDADRIRTLSVLIADLPIWEHPLTRLAALLGATVLALICITVPLNWGEQALFAVALWAIALWVRNISGRFITILLIFISLIASTRYLYWRLTETLIMEDWVDLAFGYGLLVAETYAWLILVLGYFQTVWPLGRKPAPLPEDTADWPTVDIFIPSYNEPLSVVRPTVLAALAVDWPRDKVRVYILDDGRRDEFKRFAEEVGVTHMIRPDNKHAKAGNINHALTKTHGEYIAIFDCDHMPTRSFLQVCLGWFLQDPKLAMLQTPHHFFSADPFEKNLGTFRRVPNEGELFYGLIQDGNDLWNATFFCGSCAVIKRGPLLEVGGIAVETVTEDAHTALKLHRLGYNTAYLNIPQAAGLATESLSGHIGQRIRWARGMAQIFRLDNPIFGKGLSLAQRLCYSNAMLHFFYGIPRLVFLTAPLAYMFFQAHIIYASAITIALYALPHLIHANITNSRMQGDFRHSFWAEVYEAVLAWYIMRPTTVALINPHLGKFNVTAKGGLIEEEYFDWSMSKPYMLLMVLNLIGLGVGFVRLFYWNVDESGTVLLNITWTLYNLMILGATLAVAAEARQVRRAHRVAIDLPATLWLPDGKTIRCQTTDYSEGGIGLSMPVPAPVRVGDPVRISIYRGEREFFLPGKVALALPKRVGVQFEELSLEQQMELVQATFSRADAWASWRDGRKRDAPMEGLTEIFTLSVAGYVRLVTFLFPRTSRTFKTLDDTANRMIAWVDKHIDKFKPKALKPWS